MENRKEVKLKINDSELRGVYANHIGIMHTADEFVIDFISMLPPEAIVNSRVIISPAALKRMFGAISTNIQKYEEKFGEIIIEENPEDIGAKVN